MEVGDSLPRSLAFSLGLTRVKRPAERHSICASKGRLSPQEPTHAVLYCCRSHGSFKHCHIESEKSEPGTWRLWHFSGGK